MIRSTLLLLMSVTGTAQSSQACRNNPELHLKWEPEEIEVLRNKTYGNAWDDLNKVDVRLTMDIHMRRPEYVEYERPVIMLIHDGYCGYGDYGWYDGKYGWYYSKFNERISKWAKWFARRNFVAVSIDFRNYGKASSGRYYCRDNEIQTAGIDAKAAIRHIQARAVEYKADPTRIMVMGCGSGGSIAMWAAYAHGNGVDYPHASTNDREQNARVQSVLAISAPFYTSAQIPYSEYDASLMVIHGEDEYNDKYARVKWNTLNAYYNKAKSANIPVAYIRVPKALDCPWLEIERSYMNQIYLFSARQLHLDCNGNPYASGGLSQFQSTGLVGVVVMLVASWL